MTENDLLAYEVIAATLDGNGMPVFAQGVRELLAELRLAWKERGWLARQLEFHGACVTDGEGECPSEHCEGCELASVEAWLDAARKAVRGES